MTIVFVSNYINHHQIPFCKAMCGRKDVTFYFIQTQPMEEERVRMGWQTEEELPFLKLYYEDLEGCRRLIAESDVVLFGGCDDESYIAERLRSGRPIIRISERLYKEAQWKAISPRGLVKKYQDHVRYRKAPVYLLCAGAYVADDFHLIRAYPGKMFCWGYFPEKKVYDLDSLFAGKGFPEGKAAGQKVPYLLWAARFIDWKHPELAVRTAKYLKERGVAFHLEMIGGGEMEDEIRRMVTEDGLTDVITLSGYCPPSQVRSRMERADLFLVTSDRKEGWGAVINEAMNSGCAVVADHMVGAAPYLIRHGENGVVYRDGKPEQLFALAEELALDPGRRRRLGEQAYRTIAEVWNAEHAADRLMELIGQPGWLSEGTGAAGTRRMTRRKETETGNGRPADRKGMELSPCSPAPVVRERRMYSHMMKGEL